MPSQVASARRFGLPAASTVNDHIHSYDRIRQRAADGTGNEGDETRTSAPLLVVTCCSLPPCGVFCSALRLPCPVGAG
jgi:hypothetical protein